MGLEEYRRKRNFGKSPEPAGEVKEGERLRFVVQRHHARRLHYDLRLEMEGVLKSWAVPKGPSMNPKERRLAIRTEDHPVDYLSFHGVIPKGNYGAGEMGIWDEGSYSVLGGGENGEPVEQLGRGNLKLSFEGERLRGEFALVKTEMEKDSWLLIKKKDRYAVEEPYDAEDFPETIPAREEVDIGRLLEPMLASVGGRIFDDPGWVFEVKWDGYRCLAHLERGEVKLYSRNRNLLNRKFGETGKELEKIPYDCLLDGEVVYFDESGRIDFGGLQRYEPGKGEGELRYYVFDLLMLNGIETISLDLLSRKSLLKEIVGERGAVRFCEHVVGEGERFYGEVLREGMEGVIAKKADSGYFPGVRTKSWLKIKPVKTEEVIICGFTESDKVGNVFGSLILGRYEEGELVYVGNCGSGFTGEEQNRLMERFRGLGREKSPFPGKVDIGRRNPHWVEPELVCEVRFLEWTKSGVMRQPVYLRLREEKEAEEVVSEEPVAVEEVEGNRLEISGISVPLTNLEKVYWPKGGYTKYDLIEYYVQVAPVILPYLLDRPENLHRHPDGIEKESFYQKDSSEVPEWVETCRIYSESSEREIEYLLCQNEAVLIYMANLGCIEINPWSSLIGALDKPTFALIDLDPSEKNSFEEVVEVALVVREALEMAGIEGYCKTSGSTGIHIYLPFGAAYDYEQARDFVKLICYEVRRRLPELTTLERRKSARRGRIYLDYLQNRRGQTLSAPYSVRPRVGATVSAPVRWEELEEGVSMHDFTIRTMPERLRRVGDLFGPVLGEGIDLAEALEKMAG